MSIYTDKNFRNAIIEILENDDVCKAIGEGKAHALRVYCEEMEEKQKQANERKNKKRKAEIQKLNDILIPQIEKILENSSRENPVSASMIADVIEPSVTQQKVSVLLNNMVKENSIQKEYFKFEDSIKIGYFKN